MDEITRDRSGMNSRELSLHKAMERSAARGELEDFGPLARPDVGLIEELHARATRGYSIGCFGDGVLGYIEFMGDWDDESLWTIRVLIPTECSGDGRWEWERHMEALRGWPENRDTVLSWYRM